MLKIALTVLLLLLTSISACAQKNTTQLPSGALVLETKSFKVGDKERELILWMLNPKKHPNEYASDEPYTCPDSTRGSYYSGLANVTLLDKPASKIINTLEIAQVEGYEDTYIDLPYKIRKGYYYLVNSKSSKTEVKPVILNLKDFNGDGTPFEFAIYNAEACMGLATTLIGYSEKQDKVIQYTTKLKTTQGTVELKWVDSLFIQKSSKPGFWKYEIDYRGRGGSLDSYEIRYKPEKESFEGTLISKETDD